MRYTKFTLSLSNNTALTITPSIATRMTIAIIVGSILGGCVLIACAILGFKYSRVSKQEEEIVSSVSGPMVGSDGVISPMVGPDGVISPMVGPDGVVGPMVGPDGVVGPGVTGVI